MFGLQQGSPRVVIGFFTRVGVFVVTKLAR